MKGPRADSSPLPELCEDLETCALNLLRSPGNSEFLVLGSPSLVSDPKLYSVGENVTLKLGFRRGYLGHSVLTLRGNTLSRRSRKILLEQGTLRVKNFGKTQLGYWWWIISV